MTKRPFYVAPSSATTSRFSCAGTNKPETLQLSVVRRGTRSSWCTCESYASCSGSVSRISAVCAEPKRLRDAYPDIQQFGYPRTGRMPDPRDISREGRRITGEIGHGLGLQRLLKAA